MDVNDCMNDDVCVNDDVLYLPDYGYWIQEVEISSTDIIDDDTIKVRNTADDDESEDLDSDRNINNNNCDPDYVSPDRNLISSGSESSEAEKTGLRLRKRAMKKNPHQWKKNKIASSVAAGKEHVNFRGQTIRAKEPQYPNCGKCKFKCTSHITEEYQRELFQEFRGMNRTEQRTYLVRLLVDSIPARRTVCDEDVKVGRKLTIKYCLPTGQGQGDVVRVCVPFFCKTFAISQKIPLNIIRNTSPRTGKYRSVHKNAGRRPWNATPAVKVRAVKRFLHSIPTLPAHYARKDSTCWYFEPGLNRAKLYKLYKEAESNEKVSQKVFVEIFNDHDPPLRFYHRKKDQCVVCNNEDNMFEVPDPFYLPYTVRESHILRKDIIYVLKEMDKEMALADPQRIVYCSFDLEATLMLPYADESLLYFSRKLNLYNFTIWDSNQNGTCNYWTEVDGQKSSNEIGTCLLDYLRSLEESVHHVIMYSDTCAGQNRNQYIAGAFLFAINSADHFLRNVEIIDHKLMESGHSHMECDSQHSRIEAARDGLKVYSPYEYKIIFKNARKHPKPYIVKQYKHSDFLNIKSAAEKFVYNRMRDTENETVNWLRIKWFRYVKGSTKIYFKYKVTDEEFREIDVTKSIMDPRTCSSVDIFKPIYTEKIPISIAKKKDLQELLKKGAIPLRYAEFYNSLPANHKVKDVAQWLEGRPSLEEIEIITVKADDLSP